MPWEETIIDPLLAAARPDGAWSYGPDGEAAAEPTCTACLALAAREIGGEAFHRGSHWLVRHQRPDGAVPVLAGVESPAWPTALAVLAWRIRRDGDSWDCTAASERAIHWLLNAHGLSIAIGCDAYGHNSRLTGWPWVEGTHSWVEPTSYAILALRAAGLERDQRVREAVELLLDRAIPEGGWNYGNPRMFHNTLRALPAQTGMALAALAGEPSHRVIEAGITYLSSALGRVRTPLSLAWGLIGLTAWNRRPAEASAWLAECTERIAERPVQPLHHALLLLAAATTCPLTRMGGESNG